jgi:hypothetical protein
MGAIFALGIAALADRRWGSARILLQVAALMLALILAAGRGPAVILTRLMP